MSTRPQQSPANGTISRWYWLTPTGRLDDTRKLAMLNLSEENNMKKFCLAVGAFAFCAGALAHSGGTDKDGCHRDTKSGTRHCH